MSRQPLDVYVSGQHVGTLAEEAGQFVFTYLPEIPQDKLASLLMPVRAESFTWKSLHPFFQMNLPEGFQMDTLRRRLGPHADVSDMGLLALTGTNTIGRVQVVPQGASLEAVTSKANMADLLASADSRDNLLRLLEGGVAEGVSGVMPKALVLPNDKATVWTDQFILKTGFDDLPSLAINEYLCLQVAREAGLEVPEASLSADGQVLAVRRFDREADGAMLAVEDYCALKANNALDKYKGSLEDLAKLTAVYVPRAMYKENARRLYALLLLNYAIRNQDAHLKNLALTYTSVDDVRLAPVYDVVTGTVYEEFKTAQPALTLAGKRVWSSGRLLANYGGARLGLSKAEMDDARERITNAVHKVTPMVADYAERYPDFREVAKGMLDAWGAGIEDIKPDVKPGKTVPTPLREQTGMSDPDRKARAKPANPYATVDGAFSHKSR